MRGVTDFQLLLLERAQCRSDNIPIEFIERQLTSLEKQEWDDLISRSLAYRQEAK